MPCNLREKVGISRSKRDKNNERDILAPKPVHPRAMRYHGLLSMSTVSQHLVFDEKWTPSSLTEQFKSVAEMLNRRIVFKAHESKANRQRLGLESKRLKIQCTDGRMKLQKILFGDNAHKIRNLLINYKSMQRLYQKMPIHLVVDNINQRTFVLRKERDRLESRLGQLKHEYRELLLDRAWLENRIKYQNMFVMEEEYKSRIFAKKIENSSVRLKAIKTINNTYKKMMQVLLHDEIFYEPILHSLCGDMEDQSNFIRHILYLGTPAIAKFRELSEEYRHLEDKSRKNLQAKLQILASLSKPQNQSGGPEVRAKDELPPSTDLMRYVRETQSMLTLKQELESIQKTIKEVKLTALCSQAREIYPSMRNQVHENEKLHRAIENDLIARGMLEMKKKCATVLKGVLVDNLSEEEINRLERIKDLRKILKKDEEFELESLEYMKNRADAFVMMRVSIWNLIDILRHIDRPPRSFRSVYPNSYLKLPLLKFEMLNMFSVPPELYEENIDSIMHLLKRKIYKVVKAYKKDTDKQTLKLNCDKYHQDYLATIAEQEIFDEDDQQAAVREEDLLHDKTMSGIPNRKQIKAQSAKLIEEQAKKEE